MWLRPKAEPRSCQLQVDICPRVAVRRVGVLARRCWRLHPHFSPAGSSATAATLLHGLEQILERSWDLPPWRFSRPIWVNSCLIWSRVGVSPTFGRTLGQRRLETPFRWHFCGSFGSAPSRQKVCLPRRTPVEVTGLIQVKEESKIMITLST